VTEDRSVLTRPAPPPDEVVRYGELADQVIDRWHAADPGGRPLVAIVHGGFWRPEYDRTHVGPMANALRDAGWDVAAIEYRRQPGNPDVTVSDVAAALAQIDRPLVTLGHSAGGHLVLWAAAAAPPPQLVATVALAPVADLDLAAELALDGDAVVAFLGAEPATRRDLDPARLPAPATPTAIVHGSADEIVPLAVAESYAGRHPATRLTPVAGTGHLAVIDPLSAAWPVVAGELERWARS
jgi:acetyl esterase/lipase